MSRQFPLLTRDESYSTSWAVRAAEIATRPLKASVALALVILLSACVETDYVGETYTPTSSVDVYYSMADVERPHKVMGKITATAMDGWDSEDMVMELKKQAMARGADALVVEGVHTDTTGSYTNTYGKKEPKWVVDQDGKIKSVGGSSDGYTVTTDVKEKVMDAELVKYQ